MKILGFFFAFVISSTSFADLRCLQLFTAPKLQHAENFEQTLSALRLIPTNQYRVLLNSSEMSLKEYFEFLVRQQEKQLDVLSALEFTILPQQVRDYYIFELARIIENSRKEMKKLNENYDTENIRVKDLLADVIYPLHPSLPGHLNSFSITTNSLVAEMLTAISFQTVVNFEQRVPVMLGKDWDAIYPQLKKEIPEGLLNNMMDRQMDVHALRDGKHYFIEVKYLASHKDYSSASGNNVLEKLTTLKKITKHLSYDSQVALAIVGPGRLTAESYDSYMKAGIEVIYITPQWR